MGWNSQHTSMVNFDNCEIPIDNIVGNEGDGFKIAMKGLDGGRVNIAACSLGGARAALEAIALRSREIIIEMQKDSGTTFDKLKVDGGASNNNLLMQIQSNLLQAQVIRPKITETTALGVAFFSGLATGFWSSIDEIKNIWEVEKKFDPQLLEYDKKVISNWESRIKKVL